MSSLKRLFDYIYDGKTDEAKRMIDSATCDVDAAEVLKAYLAAVDARKRKREVYTQP